MRLKKYVVLSLMMTLSMRKMRPSIFLWACQWVAKLALNSRALK